MMQQSSPAPAFLKPTLQWLVALFPILSATVKDAGSTIYILLFIFGLIWGWPAWQRLAPRERAMLWTYVGFILVLCLALINTDDWHTAGRKFERFARFLAIVPIYLLFRRVQVDLLRPIVLGAAIGCVVMALQAWWTQGGPTPAQGAYHKIVFGDSAMLLVMIVSVALLTVARQWWHYALGLLCILLGLYASMLSMTRGAWLLIPILIPIWGFLFRKYLSTRQWLSIGVGGVMLLAALIIWPPAAVKNGIEKGVAELQEYMANPGRESSWGARLNMWRDSLTLFKQHPIIGAGIGDFRYERERLMKSNQAFKGYLYGHAHNIFFHALATSGLLGFIALLGAIFVMPWRNLYPHWRRWQHKDWSRLALLCGLSTLVAFFVFGLTEGWTARNPFVNTYGLVLSAFMANALAQQEQGNET